MAAWLNEVVVRAVALLSALTKNSKCILFCSKVATVQAIYEHRIRSAVVAPGNDHCLILYFTSVLSVSSIASLEPAAPWLCWCQGCTLGVVWGGPEAGRACCGWANPLDGGDQLNRLSATIAQLAGNQT